MEACTEGTPLYFAAAFLETKLRAVAQKVTALVASPPPLKGAHFHLLLAPQKLEPSPSGSQGLPAHWDRNSFPAVLPSANEPSGMTFPYARQLYARTTRAGSRGATLLSTIEVDKKDPFAAC